MKIWLRRTAWLVLAVAAGLSTWLFLANRRGPPAAPAAAAGAAPDYRLYDAHISRFTADGALRYVLLATTVTHFPVSGDTALTAIHLDYFPGSGREWRLLAARGRLGAAGNHLALAGSVRASEVAVARPLRFAAPTVEVFLDTHRVRSDARVTVWQGAREMQGTGMLADLRTGKLTLLKDVTGRYVR